MKKKLTLCFFAAILACTFLSRLLDSVTVAKVTAQRPEKRALEYSLQGDGTVQAREEKFVIASFPAIVEAVEAALYTRVEEGDVLFRYSMEDLEKKLEETEKEIKKLELSGKEIELGGTPDARLDESHTAGQSADNAREKLDAASGEEEEARQAFERGKKSAEKEYKKAAARAKEELKEQKEMLKKDYEDAAGELDREAENYKEQLISLNIIYNQKTAEAEADYESKTAGAKARHDEQIAALAGELELAGEKTKAASEEARLAEQALENAGLADANTRKNEAKRGEMAGLQKESLQLDIQSKKQEAEEIKRLIEQEGKVLSPYTGTVSEIELMQGKASTGTELIKIAGGGLYFLGRAEREAAGQFAGGDEGSISLPGFKEELKAAVEKIEWQSDSEEALIYFSIEDKKQDKEIMPGSSGDFLIKKKSRVFQNCIPLSGIFSDSEGDYCLVMEEKATILGSEWTCRRATVEILEMDGRYVSVNADLSDSDKIVTGYSKYIREGDRVREAK